MTFSLPYTFFPLETLTATMLNADFSYVATLSDSETTRAKAAEASLAAAIGNTSGGVDFNTVKAWVQSQGYAPINSPNFTGLPVAPDPNSSSGSSSQIATVNFIQALSLSVLPIGGIILWSGAATAIPTNWHLCDGTSGTPDLRDSFVVGAGKSYTVGQTGGYANQTSSTSTAGGHSHSGTTGAHVLAITEMPSHSHTASDSGHTHSYNAVSANMQSAGNTQAVHFYQTPTTSSTTGSGTANITVGNTGGGQGHSHTIGTDGVHTHTLTSWDNRPPFLSLAYIQRVS